MSDSIRAALERLIEALDDYEPVWGGFPESALAAARAALAEQQGEAIGPEWQPCVKLPITVHVREQRPGETHVSTREGITPVQPDDLIMRGVAGEEYPIGRELFNRTYRLGVAEPTPPAEWEVAQLVARLRAYANCEQAEGRSAMGRSLTRAAELLQQQHPTPVPVSEPLPGDQLCWWYEPDEDDGYGGRWTLLRIRLPAHALPLPQGEVEA